MGLFTVTVPRRDKDDVNHIICVRSGLAHSDNTQQTHKLAHGWSNFRRIFLTIYVPVFKMFIITVVKNLVLNKRTRGPDLP